MLIMAARLPLCASGLMPAMPKRLPDIQVLIPYKYLCELLEASEEVKGLRKDNARLAEQVLALRIIQQECIEKIAELEKFI